MKKADDMSMEEMEGYFKRVDRVFHIFGSSYRIVWPFKVFSPFSPTRVLLNFGVILTWINVIAWGATNKDSPEDLGASLAGLWAVVLALCMVVGLFERHYRIKFRYHRLQRQRQFGRMVPPFFRGQRSSGAQAQNEGQTDPGTNEQQSQVKTGEVITGSREDSDLIEIGMGILKKIFR